MANILVTCAGSGVGQSVLDSLHLTGLHRITGCDLKSNVFAYNYCHSFHLAKGIYDPDYLDFILALCKKEAIDLVIPGHDHELLLFSAQRDRFSEQNIEVMVSRPDIIEISRDKYLWYQYFSQFGCQIVPTQRVCEFRNNPDPSFFPAIIKPAGGSASQGIHILHNADELEGIKDEDIIQPYLFPLPDDPNYPAIQKAIQNRRFVQLSEISIQLVLSRQSQSEGIFISRNTLKDGVPMFVDPIEPASFAYISEIQKMVTILQEKQVSGPVNLQGRITSRGLVLFEMNMRFTGITGTRAMLGFNEVEFLINNFLDKPTCQLAGNASDKLGVRQVGCATIPRPHKDLSSKPSYTLWGAGGYIGAHFLAELIKTGCYKNIYLICRSASFEHYVNRFTEPGIRVIPEGDSFLQSAYCFSDILINFSGARANTDDTQQYEAILFQHRQLQQLEKANIPFIINVSSQSVYDQHKDLKKTEDSELKTDNLYAFQKRISEDFFHTLSEKKPANQVISLRLSRVIGAGSSNQKPEGFFAQVIQSLCTNQTIHIPHPNNKINLIDIRDVSGAIMHLIQQRQERRFPPLLNIGGSNLTLRQYCDMVISTLGLREKKDLLHYASSEKTETSSLISSELANKNGWTPSYSIEQSIKEMARSLGYRNQHSN